jgi:hypothetical protein
MSNPERVNPETGVHETLSFGILGSTWIQTGDVATRTNTETGEIETESFGIFCSTWLSTGERVNTQTGEREYIGHGILGSSWMSTEERIDPETGEIQTQGHGILGSSWNSKYDSPKRINTENGEYETQSFGVIGSSWNGGSGQTYQREYDSDSNSSYGGGSTSSWADSVEDEYDPYYDDDDSDDYDENDNNDETSSNYESDFDEDENTNSDESDNEVEDYDEDDSDYSDDDDYEEENVISVSENNDKILVAQDLISNFEELKDFLDEFSVVDSALYRKTLSDTNKLFKTHNSFKDNLLTVESFVKLLDYPAHTLKLTNGVKYHSYEKSIVQSNSSIKLFYSTLNNRISTLDLFIQMNNAEINSTQNNELEESYYNQLNTNEGFDYDNYMKYCNRLFDQYSLETFKPYDFAHHTDDQDIEVATILLNKTIDVAKSFETSKCLSIPIYFKLAFDLITLLSFYPDHKDDFKNVTEFVNSFKFANDSLVEISGIVYLDCNLINKDSAKLISIVEENLKTIYDHLKNFLSYQS